MARPFRDLGHGWNRFWFAPTSTAPVALLRIAFGALATVWMLSLGPDLLTFLGPDGVQPTAPALGPGAWSLLTLVDSAPAVVLLWLVALAAAAALTIGYQTRLAALLVFVAIVSFERRNGMVFNGGDGLVRNIAFLLVLAPSGAALSYDRWTARPDRFWEFPLHAPWALRLVQIQVSVVYLSTVWAKLQGKTWGGGLATSFALRIGDIQRIPTPEFMTDSTVITNLMTFGTLAVEFSIGVLVWNRVARPWVLSIGVLFHVMIELTMMVGFFSWIVITTYLAFLSPTVAERLVGRARGLLRVGRTRSLRSDPSLTASRDRNPGTSVTSDDMTATDG